VPILEITTPDSRTGMKAFFLFLLFLGTTAYFVWPTPYVQYNAGDGPYREHYQMSITRVNRVTKEAWVRTASNTWESITLPRPGLIRPDIIGTIPAPRVDASEVQRQQRSMENMSAQADQMTRAATDASRR